MSGRRALALRSFKKEAVLAHVVRSPPTLGMSHYSFCDMFHIDAMLLPVILADSMLL
jgi:hypothetical protein